MAKKMNKDTIMFLFVIIMILILLFVAVPKIFNALGW
jgi:hypothetical protein